ncbi:MAG: PAS domain S-box protein [Ginsengibacter sp.]
MLKPNLLLETVEEFLSANKEVGLQNKEKEKWAAELVIANKALAFEHQEKEKRAAELIIANKELVFQNKEKENRAAELIIINKELAFQNKEKEKRAAELIIANKELAFQNKEKEKRAAELIIANKELACEHQEKAKRAAKLIIANKELLLQHKEKAKRAAELIIANKELAFQNKEKAKRAAELVIANKELAFQNKEKEKRATELVIANKELAFQNIEKETRTAKLIIANKELAFQSKEKEKRAAELILSKVADITKRKKNEEYIAHLAAIVEFSDDAIISKSVEGIIKSWNNGSKKMFGYTAKEAIGKHISLIIPSDYIHEEKKIIERIRNNEIIDHYETVRIKKNGARFYVSLTVSPLRDSAGNILGVSKIVRDITCRKEFEKKLAQVYEHLVFQNEEKEKRARELIIANKELAFQHKEKEDRAAELIIANKELVFQNAEKEKRAVELNISNKELVELRHSEKFAVIGRLTSILGHEIKNPLTNISMAAIQLNSSNILNKIQEEILWQIIERNCTAIKNLLDDLLQSTSTADLNFEAVDLNDVLDETLALAADRIELKKIKLEKNYSADLCRINADIKKIKIVFLNLIINAIEAMESVAGILTVTTEISNGRCKVLICDNGKGMTTLELSKLFEPFFTTKKNGTGLGLANTHNILMSHNATIVAESELGTGTIFIVTFPV